MNTTVTDRIVLRIRDSADGTEEVEELFHNGQLVRSARGPKPPRTDPPSRWPYSCLRGDAGAIIAATPVPVRPEDV